MSGWRRTTDAAGSDVIAAKDQRIHELRAALASVMSDRTVAQKEAAAARDEAVRAAAASAEAAARAAAEAEAQSKRIHELQVSSQAVGTNYIKLGSAADAPWGSTDTAWRSLNRMLTG